MSMSTYEPANRSGSIPDVEANETENDMLNQIGRRLRDEMGRGFHDWNIDWVRFWVVFFMLLVGVIFVGQLSYGIFELVHFDWNTS
jgi:hypothetical protein